MNLKTANYQQRSEIVAELGVKIYPSNDLTYISIQSILNIGEPRKASCQMTSIASPILIIPWEYEKTWAYLEVSIS